MNRLCCALIVSFGLSGCAALDELYGPAETDEVMLAATPPPPPAQPAYEFCRRIAAQEAAKDNPTRETQTRRAVTYFRDCVTAFGDI
jgi:hypothetical protein